MSLRRRMVVTIPQEVVESASVELETWFVSRPTCCGLTCCEKDRDGSSSVPSLFSSESTVSSVGRHGATTMTAQAPSESLHLVRQEPVPFELLPHEGQQLRVGAGWELYWDKRAVHLDGGGPDAVPGVRYVGIVNHAWFPWARLFSPGHACEG